MTPCGTLNAIRELPETRRYDTWNETQTAEPQSEAIRYTIIHDKIPRRQNVTTRKMTIGSNFSERSYFLPQYPVQASLATTIL